MGREPFVTQPTKQIKLQTILTWNTSSLSKPHARCHLAQDNKKGHYNLASQAHTQTRN